MKKLLLLAALSLPLAFTSTAQQRTFTKDADTSVNAATVNLSAPSTGYAKTTSIVINLVKVSGTGGGYAIVQGSHDGITYANISTDTMVVTNVASQAKAWSLGEAAWNYYRVKYVSTQGTQRTVPRATILFRND